MKRAGLIAIVVGVLVSLLSSGWPLLPTQAVPPAVAVEADPGADPGPAGTPACVIGPGAECAGADLTGRDLKGVDLSGANLTSALLDHADASGANLSRADLLGASLHQVNLSAANLASADFTSANLTQASVSRASGQGMNASWASLVKADFTGSDFTGGSFRSVMGTQVNFTDARLVDADLTGADLYAATLSGADLTNALLRNASLLKSTIDATTTLTGADLSGATWTDGRLCAEGSIGTCTFTPGVDPDAVTAELPGSAAAVAAVIKIALMMGKYANDCSKNVPKTGSCWDAGGPDLSAITNEIAELRRQIEANQLALVQAMNEIFRSQAEEAMLTRFNTVKKSLLNSSFALLKYQEFSNCLAQFNNPKTKYDLIRNCTLTNVNGLNPQPYAMTSVDDLFTGSTGPLTDDMQYGGPAARLYFATLYQLGGKAGFQPSNLRDAGLDMQQNIAGDQSHKGKDGLLYATFKSRNADLISSQIGRTGATPRFLPGTYLAQMNNWTNYYVNGQVSYFGPVVAALTLRGNAADQSAQDRKSQLAMAQTLADQASSGVLGQPLLALDQQLTTYTVPLDYYEVNVDQPTNRPETVGFVTGSDGKVYRIQQKYGATATPVGLPQFAFPTFNQLALVKSSVEESGARWSSIQAANPAMLPAGSNAAWWASFGTRYKVFELGNPFYGKTNWTAFVSSNLAPADGRFGDNITWLRYNEPCLIPVRLWDSRPSIKDSYLADQRRSAVSWDNYDFVNQKFFGRDVKNGKKFHEFTVNGQSAYDAVVRTGATPAYDINNPFQVWTLPGTGLLWRCNGRHSNNAADVNASWVSIRPLEAKGLFTLLSPGPVQFESCTELRQADWRGIGLPEAHDRLLPGDAETSLPRDNMHLWDAEWYEVNRQLDSDNDGIACELTQ